MRLVPVGVVAASAALAVGVGTATGGTLACKPTVSQGAGPFGRTAGTPPHRSTFGRGHVLSGLVVRYPSCTPVRGAFVEIWQESPKVGYVRAGRASLITGRNGAFRFQGPVPASDGGFPPHIHVHVNAGGYDDVVTTYLLRPGEKSGRITIVLVSAL